MGLKSVDDEKLTANRRSAGWDVKNAGKNYLTMVAAQVGISVFSFLTVWLTTRFLGAEGYGGLAAMLVASQWTQIVLMWTCTALGRFGVEEFVETGFITKTFWARILIFLPNLLLVILLSPLWLPPFGVWLKLPADSYSLIVLHFSLTAIAMHVQFALQAAKLTQVFSVLQMIEKTLVLALLSFFILAGTINWRIIFLIYAAALTINILIGFWQLRPYLSFDFSFDKKRVRDIFWFSLPLPLYSLLMHFSFNHLDSIFILNYLTVADLGVYSAAYQINGMFLQLPMLAGSLLLPFFVTVQLENQAEQVRRVYFAEVVPLVTLSLGTVCVGIAAVGYYVLPLIFGADFAQVGGLLLIFAAATTLSVPVVTGLMPLSNSTSTTFVQMFAAFAAAAVNIGFNFLLIPHFALIGCAWATVLACAASLLTFALILARKFEIPFVSSLLATIPVLGGAIGFTIYGNLLLAIGLVILLNAVIILSARRSFAGGLKKLRNLRT